MKMSSRQIFLAALHNEQPERVPIFDFPFSQSLFDHFLATQGAEYTTENLVRVSRALGLDAVAVTMGAPPTEPAGGFSPDCYRDEWQVVYRRIPEASWPGDAPIAAPVAEREDWDVYHMPDPQADLRLRELRTAQRMCDPKEMAITGIVIGPYTAAWLILGLENLSIKLYDDPDLVMDVLKSATDFYLRIGVRMIEQGVDALWIADDLGHVSGPFMSPRHFRRFVLPHLIRMARAFRQRGVPVILHSDGDIRLFLDDLVETDINALHPIERAASMDLAACKTRYGDRLCLIGNVDNKETLVRGTPQSVEREVFECLRTAAPGGGYVLASDHSLHDDIPLENVIAMFETARRHGSYTTKAWES